jgi:molybdopterin synthase sulfur carrier subunit
LQAVPDSRSAPVVVSLVYLARLREAFGRGGESLTLANADPTVADVLHALRARGEPYARELAAGRAFRVAVNHDVADHDARVRDGDEIALLPPVTGG